GSTVRKLKRSVLESIEINKDLGNIPNEEFKVIFKYDTQSLLAYYNGIFTKAGLERITGINQK
ncbi:hypothetical protein, partial [Shewanella algae]|uniref:hypothetical protein n=1 Tax=Shewanella algae TaxID=38313 RepID=UPI00313B1D84